MLDDIRTECFMLCDAAQESNGKRYILGGGWDSLFVPTLPWTQRQLALAIRLAVPWNEGNRPHSFQIELLDEDRNNILPGPFEGQLRVGRPPTALEGQDLPILLAVTAVDLVFPTVGTYVFRLVIDGREQATTMLLVRKAGEV